MSFPSYPAYKDSGVEWLGSIPTDWNVKRVKHLLREGYDGTKIGPFGSQLTSDMLDDNGSYKVYGQENVIAGNFERGTRFISTSKFEELSVYEIKPGDILVTMMGTSGRCEIVPNDVARGIMDSHLLRLRVVESIASRFLRLLIDEADYVGHQVLLFGKGSIMHGLNSTIVKELSIAVPAPNEQKAILDFLDREIAKIDALITEQQRLIELLREKRQAVISHAVTKGLNPDAPMKDSGVEWLGKTPAHWKLMRMRRVLLCPLSNGIFKKKEDFGDGVLLINVIDVYRPTFVIEFELLDRVMCDASEIENYEALFGDLLFVRSSLKQEGIAVVAMVDSYSEPVVFECHLIRARPNRQVLNSRFGSYVLNSFAYRSAFIAKAKVTTMTTIDQEAILSTQLLLPSILEQNEIVTFLDKEVAKIDSLTSEAQTAIDLLQERRTALISAAVIGKIDVRGLVEKEAA